MLNSLTTHLYLLIHTPKDYIYSLRYSGRGQIKIRPYNPKSYLAANSLLHELKEVYPKLDLYLIGSVGLRIEGRGDIDIFATAPPDKYKEAMLSVSTLFGKPVKVRRNRSEWVILYHQYPAEIVLTTPQDKNFQKQLHLFNLLKNNRRYLREYRNLKKKLNTCSEKEYVIRRMEFFDRVLSEG